MTNWIAAIDYSMSCPAITMAKTNEPFSFETCKLFYLSDKKPKVLFDNILGTTLGNYTGTEERFDLISDWALSSIKAVAGDDTVSIFIEDYSFGSTGQVFQIAENAGLLKHKLWRAGYKMTLLAPTLIKKDATGKGTAKKEQMHEAFKRLTGIDLHKPFQPKAIKVGSPVGDLVDSFFIAKYAFGQLTQ